jgi:hypothetical protein
LEGFARQPIQGIVQNMAHVRDNICSGDEEAYQYLRKWLSAVFQYPDAVHTAIVLCGSQASAKIAL